MYRACIAIVDASRARLFTYERETDAEGPHEALTEQRDLVNPSRRLRASELFSESRPPSSRTGGLQYTLDDHRDHHIEEIDAAFSRMIVSEIAALLRSGDTQRLIVCASPNMLGQLRAEYGELRRDKLELEELPRDLVKLTPAQLRDQLASYGMLPEPPPRPGLN
jgi:protein required for attachment to host cells